MAVDTKTGEFSISLTTANISLQETMLLTLILSQSLTLIFASGNVGRLEITNTNGAIEKNLYIGSICSCRRDASMERSRFFYSSE